MEPDVEGLCFPILLNPAVLMVQLCIKLTMQRIAFVYDNCSYYHEESFFFSTNIFML